LFLHKEINYIYGIFDEIFCPRDLLMRNIILSLELLEFIVGSNLTELVVFLQ